MVDSTNFSVSFRGDDSAVVVSLDCHVSHRKQAGPWKSTFSLTMSDAEELSIELEYILARHKQGVP
jgi:hypothetical protein